MKRLRGVNRAGYTLIEMIVVMLILSFITAFLYNMFSQANKITEQSSEHLDLYHDMTYFQQRLYEDLAASHLMHDADFYKTFFPLWTANQGAALRQFLLKDNEILFIAFCENPLDSAHLQPDDVHLVRYGVDADGQLTRKLYVFPNAQMNLDLNLDHWNLLETMPLMKGVSALHCDHVNLSAAQTLQSFQMHLNVDSKTYDCVVYPGGLAQ